MDILIIKHTTTYSDCPRARDIGWDQERLGILGINRIELHATNIHYHLPYAKGSMQHACHRLP